MRLVIVRQTDNVVLVRAIGEVEHQTVGDLAYALLQIQLDDESTVLLDLCDVTLIDSVGIGVLLSARRRAERTGNGFVVVAEPNGPVQRAVEAVGLTPDVLPVFATRALATSTLHS